MFFSRAWRTNIRIYSRRRNRLVDHAWLELVPNGSHTHYSYCFSYCNNAVHNLFFVNMSSDAEDFHPPLSPPRTAEKLFGLGDLDTQNISAAALAQQIRSVDLTGSSAIITMGGTIATDSFCTAAEFPTMKRNSLSDIESRIRQNPPSDILATNLIWGTGATDDLSTDSGYPLDDEDIQEVSTKKASSDFIAKEVTIKRTIESKKNNLSYIPESTEEADISMDVDAPVTESHVEDGQSMQIDAAETVYDKAKDIWAWGKGLPIVSPFLGLAEGVAGKFVGIATGQSMESLDRTVTDQLQIFDDAILNPALQRLVQVLLKVSGESEKFVKPIIIQVLTPLGLIKTTAENPEVTTVAGVTVTHG
jgi:hypothetical protein